ncbi:hypothetical protein BB558_007046 [Smittium angustum]|uniref:DNA repair protein RAD16 n=2 Tax=Harpellales TaxID=61421 RepID=A0A2U1IW25_SMIAN|nr:hypothetical protein BB558_007046 [Smittium angustum]
MILRKRTPANKTKASESAQEMVTPTTAVNGKASPTRFNIKNEKAIHFDLYSKQNSEISDDLYYSDKTEVSSPTPDTQTIKTSKNVSIEISPISKNRKKKFDSVDSAFDSKSSSNPPSKKSKTVKTPKKSESSLKKTTTLDDSDFDTPKHIKSPLFNKTKKSFWSTSTLVSVEIEKKPSVKKNPHEKKTNTTKRPKNSKKYNSTSEEDILDIDVSSDDGNFLPSDNQSSDAFIPDSVPESDFEPDIKFELDDKSSEDLDFSDFMSLKPEPPNPTPPIKIPVIPPPFKKDDPVDIGIDGEVIHEHIKPKKTRNRTGKSKRAKKTEPKLSRRDRISLNLHENHEVIRGAWETLAEKEKWSPGTLIQPDGLKMNLLPFQIEGAQWMKNKEDSLLKGGVLADEMGMGKTIQTISLFLLNPGNGPTLVVTPTVALIQWKKEIEKYAPGLKVLTFYGTTRTKSIKEIHEYDVVLTTFAVLESIYRKQRYGFRRKGTLVKESSILHKVQWYRVVLDEAHNIKDRSSNTSRAAFDLEAQYRWCLSGTPLQNRVGELYSLIRFLKYEPFSFYLCSKCNCEGTEWKFGYNEYKCRECDHSSHQHVCWWNFEILKPIQNNGSRGIGEVAFTKLRSLIDSMMLRRTKIEKASDLGLPPKVVVLRKDRFSPEELDFYNSLFTNSRRAFDTFASNGTVLNNYANIFELITKMRLAVNHPDLLTAKLKSSKADVLVCTVCQYESEDPIVSKCKHTFCRGCAIQYVESCTSGSPQCPSCFAALTIDLTQPTFEEPETGNIQIASKDHGEDTMITTPKTMVYRRSIVNRIDMTRWVSSTKIEALVEELQKLRRSDANIKSIVFSQYVSFLDLVQWRLNRAGFSVCRLDGRMSPQQRDTVIDTFMTKPQYTVFLVSLKAGGVALNLTEASQVFICDPWWNPAVEDQAMDRIHRLGQKRPIKTTRLIVENSIEARIVEIQARKRDLFQSTIGNDTAALSRLTEEDMEYLFTQ